MHNTSSSVAGLAVESETAPRLAKQVRPEIYLLDLLAIKNRFAADADLVPGQLLFDRKDRGGDRTISVQSPDETMGIETFDRSCAGTDQTQSGSAFRLNANVSTVKEHTIIRHVPQSAQPLQRFTRLRSGFSYRNSPTHRPNHPTSRARRPWNIRWRAARRSWHARPRSGFRPARAAGAA